jgi:hypothetical protein
MSGTQATGRAFYPTNRRLETILRIAATIATHARKSIQAMSHREHNQPSRKSFLKIFSTGAVDEESRLELQLEFAELSWTGPQVRRAIGGPRRGTLSTIQGCLRCSRVNVNRRSLGVHDLYGRRRARGRATGAPSLAFGCRHIAFQPFNGMFLRRGCGCDLSAG